MSLIDDIRKRLAPAASDTASFAKAIFAAPAQGVVNGVRGFGTLALGGVNAISNHTGYLQGIQKANQQIPEAQFGTKALTNVANRGIIPRQAVNPIQTATDIGAGFLTPGGIGEIGALEKAPALAKLAGYTALRAGEGAAFGGLQGLSTGDRNAAIQGAKFGALTGGVGNLVLSPRLGVQATKEAGRIVENTIHANKFYEASKLINADISNLAKRTKAGEFLPDLSPDVALSEKGVASRVDQIPFSEEEVNAAIRSKGGIQSLAGKTHDPHNNINNVAKVNVYFDGDKVVRIEPERPEFEKYVHDVASGPTNANVPEGKVSEFSQYKNGKLLTEEDLQQQRLLAGAQARREPAIDPMRASTPEGAAAVENVNAQNIPVQTELPPNTGTGSGLKERKFITTVKESPSTAAETKPLVSGDYKVKSEADRVARADARIAADPSEALNYARSGSSDEHVTTAIQLSLKLQREGNHQLAADIVNELAPKLTDAGRTVQAASLYNSLSPEGVAKFAAGTIAKYNEAAKVKIPGLTGEQLKSLEEEAARVQTLAPGRDQNLARQKLLEHISDLTPSPLWKKITSVWKAGLLTGLKTTGTNVLANTAQAGLETVKDAPAALIDSVAALFSGKRTKTLTTKGYGTGFKEGFEKGFDYLKTGYDERNVGSKLDYHRVNFGDSKIAKALQTYEESIFRFVGAQDQPSYYGAKSRSLYDQAFAAAKNAGLKGEKQNSFVTDFVTNPSDEALKIATRDASVATFQNDTQLGNLAKGIQNAGGGFGELFVPFGKTPAAAATSLVSYTPVGIAKTLIENIGKGKFDQRQFSEGLGRGLTGTAILAVGAALARKGLITGAAPTNTAERTQWELEGKKPNSILVNGKWRSIQPFGTAGMGLVIGQTYQKALDESGSPSQAIAAATAGMGKVVTDQSFLKGVSGVLNAVNDPTRYAQTLVESTAGSAIPTQVADIASSTDPVQREVNTVGDALKSRVPGLRQGLIPKRDVFGGELPRPTNGVQSYLDPFRPSDVRTDPISSEIDRLQSTGESVVPSKVAKSVTVGGEKISLTPQQQDSIEQLRGKTLQTAYTGLINDPLYGKLSDEQKAKALKSVTSDVTAVAQVQSLLPTLSNDQLGKALVSLTKDQKTLLTNPQTYVTDVPKSTAAKTIDPNQVQEVRDRLNSGTFSNFSLGEGGVGGSSAKRFGLPTLKKTASSKRARVKKAKVLKIRTLKVPKQKAASLKVGSPKKAPKISLVRKNGRTTA